MVGESIVPDLRRPPTGEQQHHIEVEGQPWLDGGK